MEISFKKLIAPVFYNLHEDVKHHKYTHYWLKGGRASTKSSYISLEIIAGLTADKNANAICFRKYGVSLEKSVYNQIKWAINQLNLGFLWKTYKSPLRIEQKYTHQEILFVGLDDPQKLKSLKPSNGGYFKYSWFEEVSELDGLEEIRNIEQSVLRGGDDFISFKSFNPPENTANWVNVEVQQERSDRIIHHSTYLDVPPEWLGKTFIVEAEHLKKVNEKAYRHEYLGEAVGTGLNVFTNIQGKPITDEEIKKFDYICEGIDWGYSIDPFVFTQCYYNRKYKRLYIFDEIYQVGLSNDDAIDLVYKKHNKRTEIIADSEEPKSIDDFECSSLSIRGAKKGAGSIRYGIKRLQGLEAIIIDPSRCPNTFREFVNYSYIKNPDGTVKSQFPDKDNHSIDSIRYALEDEFSY